MDWKPKMDQATGMPLEMRTPGGKVLPLMVMERRAHTKKFCKDKPCRNNAHWQTIGTNYLQVAHRLVWFREDHPDWSIQTAFQERSDDWCLARATILDATDRIIATATKQEAVRDFGDFMEKAETGAVGRALALCGYGTQFAPEFDEGERIVDSPHAAPKRPTKAEAVAQFEEARKAQTPEPEPEDDSDLEALEVAEEPSIAADLGLKEDEWEEVPAPAESPAMSDTDKPEPEKPRRGRPPFDRAKSEAALKELARQAGFLDGRGELHVYGPLVEAAQMIPGLYAISTLDDKKLVAAGKYLRAWIKTGGKP